MLIYKGKVISLFKEDRRLPDGRVVRIDLIRHPGAVLIVPFLTRDKIIFLRQFRPVLGKTIYELPAGTLNEREAPLACARRELIEETGHAARRMRLIGSIYPVPGYSDEKIWIYEGTGLKQSFLAADDDEVIKTVVLSKAEVRGLFARGKIQDAKTLAALAYCGWL
jgi:ADP-ribose pyrophosphatase